MNLRKWSFFGLIFVMACVPEITDPEVTSGSFALNQDADSIEINFELGEYDIQNKYVESATYTTIEYASSLKTKDWGFAELPRQTISVQLPPLGTTSYEIVEMDTEEIPLSHPMLPSKGVIYRNTNPRNVPVVLNPRAKEVPWYPQEPVTLSNPFIVRDVRGLSVFVYPFQYNAAQNKLRVHKFMRIRIRFAPSVRAINPLMQTAAPVTAEMETIYRNMFVNYRSDTRNPSEEIGEILVLHTARDAQAIAPWVEWKRDKGFVVHTREVERGTNVASLIREEYNANNKLLYVQLVGDWADIKSNLLTSQSAPGDPMLGCVKGNDKFPDLMVGRFSASSAQQVSAQVEKSIRYEKKPDEGGAWYKRGLGIGSPEGPGDDGELDYEHVDVIKKNKLLPYTYSEVSEAYKSPGTAVVSNSINEGVSIINYTGHGDNRGWVTSGYGVSNVNNASNADRLPFVISVACLNGMFHGSSDCFAEALLRKQAGGAIGAVMSTINQPWEPPMRGQDYMNDLLIGGYDYSSNPGKGTSTDSGKTTMGSVFLGGLTLMYAESSNSEDLETIQTWTLFGDASLQLRNDTPKPIELTNDSVNIGLTYKTQVLSNGQPVPNAWVNLRQGEQSVGGFTDANGKIELDHDFDTGKVTLVVTGYNLDTIARQFEVSAPVFVQSIVLSGNVDDDVMPLFLTANGEEISVDQRGNWRMEFSYEQQDTSIQLDVCDAAGNFQSQSVMITRD